MGRENSPTFKQGRADGLADGKVAAAGDSPTGPRPPYPDHPVMYQYGYEEGFQEGLSAGADAADDGPAEPGGAFTVDTSPITV